MTSSDDRTSRQWRAAASLGWMLETELRKTVDHVYKLVGRPLTAYLAGARNVATLHLATEKADESVASWAVPRLRFVLRLSADFRADNAIILLRPWLREVDPQLGAAPATIIRASHDPSAREHLWSYAQTYLHGA